jgi:aspartate/methionine/tyrosine aminotransferase
VFHIHDEAYEYFVHGGATHFSPGAIAGAADHTISLFTLSKAYGMASWRVGYMVFPAHLEDAVNKVQDTVIICAPVISQQAAVAAIGVGRRYVDARLPDMNDARLAALSALNRADVPCDVPDSQGAFYHFLRIHSALTPMALCERLVREHRVAVIPGSAFGRTDGCSARVSYGSVDRPTLSEGLGRLARGLQVLAVVPFVLRAVAMALS